MDSEPEIQDKYKELKDLILHYETERQKGNANIANIAKTQEPMKNEQKLTNLFKSKLKNLYQTAIEDAETERDLLRKSLTLIREIQVLSYERPSSDGSKETIRKGALMKLIMRDAATLPLWVGRKKEKPPLLCGTNFPDCNYVANVGDKVAAFSETLKVWILAKVTNYNQSTNEYEVEDIDEEVKEKYILGHKDVIPLPLYRVNPETNPQYLYPRDTIVLALFPQTTSFYKAIVAEPPTKAQEPYRLLFEDKNYESGYAPPMSVAQRYVVTYDVVEERNH